MASKKIGVIDHYYDKIQVAVVKLDQGKLKVGERIKIFDKDGNELFEQEVSSMQINGENIKEAKKGDDFGMKVDQAVKPGHEVHLVKE